MKMPNCNKLDTMFNPLFHNCFLSYKKSILRDIKNKTKQKFSHFSHRNMGCQMISPIASIVSGCTALFGKSMYDNFLPLPTPCSLEHTSLDCHNPMFSLYVSRCSSFSWSLNIGVSQRFVSYYVFYLWYVIHLQGFNSLSS